METHLSYSLFFLALFLFSLAHGFDHSDDLQRLRSTLHKTWQNAPSDLSFRKRPSTYEALTDVGFRSFRRLQQFNSRDVCEWDTTADGEPCNLSAHGIQELLSLAKNPVAAFLRRGLICSSAKTQKQCINLKCQWEEGPDGCFTSFEEFRTFHSADCLKPVDHIIDLREGVVRCRGQLTEGDCNAAKECSWSSNGQCSFDAWMFYHGVKSVDNFPVTFAEVRRERRAQLANDFNRDIEAGAITSVEDLLTFEASAFDCPRTFNSVVCDFVDAFTPYELQDAYCAFKYNAPSALAACRSDKLCMQNDAAAANGDLCIANDEDFVLYFPQGALAFAESIADKESRRYEILRATCSFIADETSCDRTKDCVWLNKGGYCSVDNAWFSREIGRLVVDTKDPVCQYFRLPADQGCSSAADSTACTNTIFCSYDEMNETCDIGSGGRLLYAMSESNLVDTFVDTLDACNKATSASTCAAVKI